jgi:SpoVK/Ycf46/Vps4 family AAA+-type ATPase
LKSSASSPPSALARSLAAVTPGFSARDLTRLCREAAILAYFRHELVGADRSSSNASQSLPESSSLSPKPPSATGASLSSSDEALSLPSSSPSSSSSLHGISAADFQIALRVVRASVRQSDDGDGGQDDFDSDIVDDDDSESHNPLKTSAGSSVTASASVGSNSGTLAHRPSAWDAIVGLESTKRELRALLHQWTHAHEVHRLGVAVASGALLVGAPGGGKSALLRRVNN